LVKEIFGELGNHQIKLFPFIKGWVPGWPGKVINSSQQWQLKMSRNYLFKDDWLELEKAI